MCWPHFASGHKAGAALAAVKFILIDGRLHRDHVVWNVAAFYGLFMARLILAAKPALCSGITNGIRPGFGRGPSGMVFAEALIAIFLGVGFKIALVPAHFWCPEVFEGAGMDVTTFLSVASKSRADWRQLMRILVTLSARPAKRRPLRVAVPAAMPLIIGSLTALCGGVLELLSQINIKRLFAWSGHRPRRIHAAPVGMAALASPSHANIPGDPLTPAELLASPAAETLLFYLLMYLFMNGVLAVDRRRRHRAAAHRAPSDAPACRSASIKSFRRCLPGPSPPRKPAKMNFANSPPSPAAPRSLAATMLVFLLSLAGVPLTVGIWRRGRIKPAQRAVVRPRAGRSIGIAIAIFGVSTVVLAFFLLPA